MMSQVTHDWAESRMGARQSRVAYCVLCVCNRRLPLISRLAHDDGPHNEAEVERPEGLRAQGTSVSECASILRRTIVRSLRISILLWFVSGGAK